MPWMVIITMRNSISCTTVICLLITTLLSGEMPPVNLWPPDPFSINLRASTIATYFLSLALLVFNLVTGKNNGSDDPLAFVGCKQLLCLCAGTVHVAGVVLPTDMINLGF